MTPADAIAVAVAALLAALLAHVGTPVAIAAARATGFMDRPAGDLKRHREPTPYLGGLAVFVPFITAAALVFPLDARFLAVMLAATLATLLGLMDDFGAMRPAVKLAGQVVIVLVLLRAGVQVRIEATPEWLNLALTAGWVLAVMNAFNFLDVMDGLAATVGFVAAASFVAVAVATGDPHLASVSALLAGALGGYLRHSLPPARIFLGDAGSHLLGATLATLALALDYSARNPWAVFAPLALLSVPLFELGFTVLIRLLGGRRPWRGSPDHVALRMRRLGLRPSGIVAGAAVAGAAGGVLATWMVRIPAGSAASQAVVAALGGGMILAVAAAVLLARAPDD